MSKTLHLTALLLLASSTATPAFAQKAEKTETKTTTETKDDDSKRPPLPADKTISQSARIGGRVINYKATIGKIAVRDDKGKEIGIPTPASTKLVEAVQAVEQGREPAGIERLM